MNSKILFYEKVSIFVDLGFSHNTRAIPHDISADEAVIINTYIDFPQTQKSLVTPVVIEDMLKIGFLIDGISTLDNMLEFKPDAQEAGFYIVRLKEKEAYRPEKITEELVSSFKGSSAFKTIGDCVEISVAYGRLLLKGFPAKNIGELQHVINDSNQANSIQLRAAKIEDFDMVNISYNIMKYVYVCLFFIFSHRVLIQLRY